MKPTIVGRTVANEEPRRGDTQSPDDLGLWLSIRNVFLFLFFDGFVKTCGPLNQQGGQKSGIIGPRTTGGAPGEDRCFH